jgi:hypothetical protein
MRLLGVLCSQFKQLKISGQPHTLSTLPLKLKKDRISPSAVPQGASMRFRFFLVLSVLAFPGILASKTFNEATIDLLEGTVMVQPADGSKSYALQTGSVIEKGDILTCYDKSWVILKTHRGDRIGLDGDTVVTLDEYYIEGPDRQIRLILQRGNLFLKTNGSGSRQSFFEINSGSVVTAINDTRAILHYNPKSETLKVQFLTGKLSVVDKDNEQKFTIEHSENSWTNGKMDKDEPEPLDDLDVVNFNKFFDGDPRLPPANNDFLLKGSD